MPRVNYVFDHCPECGRQMMSDALRALFNVFCRECGECDARESGMDITTCAGLQDVVKAELVALAALEADNERS